MEKLSLVALALMVLALAPFAAAQGAQTPAQICDSAASAEPASRTFSQPEQVLEAGVDYRAVLCTEAGPVYVDLLEEYTPVTVNSFVFLAQNGYYNNTTFHRVIQSFMAQGGDPTGTGTGDPGYQFQDEFVGFLHFDVPGWLAMANVNQPEAGIVGTNGSQFFITTVPTPHLDYRHTIFGEVLEGQENVLNIRLHDPQSDPNPGTRLDTVVIITDPASVTTTYVAPEAATQEDIVNALSTMELPESLENSVTQATTEEVVSSAPEAVREDLASFLSEHNHQFRVTGAVQNCDLAEFPFIALTYTVDAFETREDAAAVLDDELFAELPLQFGFTDSTSPETLNRPMFMTSITACDVPATHALTHWQRGHYVITAEVVLPTDSQFPPDLWLVGVVERAFERELSDALRREIR